MVIHNWKSGVMNVMYYIALAMAEATKLVAAYYFNMPNFNNNGACSGNINFSNNICYNQGNT